jgi:signal transduction histidine kinase
LELVVGIDESLDFGPAGRDWNADFGLIRRQCGGIKRLRQEKERDRREKEVACFRIVQEALNNAIKHAKAKKVHVNLINKGKVVSIGVEDEGVGFDPVTVDEKPGGKGRLGILIMEERAVQLGGTFSLESRIGGGTQIFVEIPV